MNQPKKRSVKIPLFLCVLLTFTVYFPGLTGGFVFDDHANILLNKKLHIEQFDIDSIISASFSSNSGALKRPISMFSFAVNNYYSDNSPFSYKIINLLIHLLTGIALFFLTRLILSTYYKKNIIVQSINTEYWLPVIISLIWLLHPINLTSVLYVIQRMTSLASLFMVIGIYSYIIFRNKYLTNPKQFWLIPTSIITFSFFAIFSKENGVLLSVYLLLMETILFRFRDNRNNIDYGIVTIFTFILFIPIIIVLGFLIFSPDSLLGTYSYRDFTLTERVLTEFRVLVFYLKLILLPNLTELGLFHDDIAISISLTNPLSTFLSLITLIVLFLTALFYLKKHPLFSAGILWFFVGHLLESTIFPLELAHEHRNYLASFGIIFSICYAISQLILFKKNKLLTSFTVATYILVISSVTAIRSYQWGETSLHSFYEVLHHPNSTRATYEAGRHYANLTMYAGLDKSAKALKYLEKSRELNSTDILPNISLLIFSYKVGLPIKSIWLKEAIHKLKTLPIQQTSIASLGELIRCQAHECKLTHNDIKSLFEAALSNESKHEQNRRNPGILITYAYYSLQDNKNDKLGYALFREAVEQQPDNIPYRIAFIDVLLSLGLQTSAKEQLNYIINNNPIGLYNNDIRKIISKIKSG